MAVTSAHVRSHQYPRANHLTATCFAAMDSTLTSTAVTRVPAAHEVEAILLRKIRVQPVRQVTFIQY
ncbi:hypothetical protein ScPMuIL_002977 [Solemya velum]